MDTPTTFDDFFERTVYRAHGCASKASAKVRLVFCRGRCRARAQAVPRSGRASHAKGMLAPLHRRVAFRAWPLATALHRTGTSTTTTERNPNPTRRQTQSKRLLATRGIFAWWFTRRACLASTCFTSERGRLCPSTPETPRSAGIVYSVITTSRTYAQPWSGRKMAT